MALFVTSTDLDMLSFASARGSSLHFKEPR
jgi:hypothetical protein